MLRDVMEWSGLSAFAEAGLVIFLVTFVVVVLRVVSRQRGHYEPLARLPLQDEDADTPAAAHEAPPEAGGRGVQ